MYQSVVTRVARVEFGKLQAIPTRPLALDLVQDRGEAPAEFGVGSGDQIVLDAVEIGEADEGAAPLLGGNLQGHSHRRARPLVSVDADFSSRRYPEPSQQIVPLRQCEET